jgi:protease-4
MVDDVRPEYAGHRPPPPPPPPHHCRRRGVFGTLALILGIVIIASSLLFVGMVVGVAAGLLGGLSGEEIGTTVYRKGEGSGKVAVLPIRGVIEDSTVTFVHKTVEAILKDHDVKAVVLRIESPGGGATASDEIHQEIARLKNEGGLPLIASYGDYAASGGYYVSCQSDVIISQPTCITGSIGVIVPYFTAYRLLKEKLGIDPEVMTSTVAVDKDTGSFMRPWTDKDRAEIRHMLDAVQEQFVKVVAEGRKGKLSVEDVKKIATGKALVAGDALEAKLVDRIGYLDDAITEAIKRGGLSTSAPVHLYKRRSGIFDDLGMTTPVRPAEAKGLSLPIDTATMRKWIVELSVPQRLMLWQP